MPKTYNKPDSKALELLKVAIKNWHPDLVEAEAKVALVMVGPAVNDAGDVTTPAITMQGVAVAARVGLVSPKRRVYMEYDVEIEIDETVWTDFDEDKRLALLDHELEHVQVRRDRNSAIARDDDLRPKLRLGADDYMLTGFVAVAKRHGRNAIEVMSLRSLWDEYGQGLFPFAAAAAKRKAG